LPAALQYPGIATAAISGPEAVGDTMKYTFERAIGSKATPMRWSKPLLTADTWYSKVL
jgi:hypothetical protein